MPNPKQHAGPLDPQVATLLEEVAQLGLPPMETLSPEVARADFIERKRLTCGPHIELAKVEDLSLPGPGGDIPIRIYTPEGQAPFPALVFFHGGGWVLGNLDTHDPLCRALTKQAGCIVVAVDYRLAPEHTFPAAVEDALAATLWVGKHGGGFGVGVGKIALGGDSAGGTLATVTAMQLRETELHPVLQCLVYPVTDLSNQDTESYQEFSEGYLLTKAAMAYFRASYLNREDERADPLASPLLATDLTRLPPAWVLTCGFDPLRDEGHAYAQRLNQAGVPSELVCYEDQIHGFIGMALVIDRAGNAIREWAAVLRRAFGTEARSA